MESSHYRVHFLFFSKFKKLTFFFVDSHISDVLAMTIKRPRLFCLGKGKSGVPATTRLAFILPPKVYPTRQIRRNLIFGCVHVLGNCLTDTYILHSLSSLLYALIGNEVCGLWLFCCFTRIWINGHAPSLAPLRASNKVKDCKGSRQIARTPWQASSFASRSHIKLSPDLIERRSADGIYGLVNVTSVPCLASDR